MLICEILRSGLREVSNIKEWITAEVGKDLSFQAIAWNQVFMKSTFLHFVTVLEAFSPDSLKLFFSSDQLTSPSRTYQF